MPRDVERARKILSKSRFQSKKAFKTKFAQRMQKTHHESGTLVLLRNLPQENTMSMERKTNDRYMGPYMVIRQTQGGSYILQELNGNQLRHAVAAFRLIPFIQREDLEQLAESSGSEDSHPGTVTKLGSDSPAEDESSAESSSNTGSDNSEN